MKGGHEKWNITELEGVVLAIKSKINIKIKIQYIYLNFVYMCAKMAVTFLQQYPMNGHEILLSPGFVENQNIGLLDIFC